jgi:peptidyl-tRNA hydrolase
MIEPILYILVRTDLASLTPGKVAAQVSHASTAFAIHNARTKLLDQWANHGDTRRGFGTAIVLGVDDDVVILEFCQEAIDKALVAGVICDPSYPLRDGDYTHLIKLITCGYIFGDREVAGPLVAHLSLLK